MLVLDDSKGRGVLGYYQPEHELRRLRHIIPDAAATKLSAIPTEVHETTLEGCRGLTGRGSAFFGPPNETSY